MAEVDDTVEYLNLINEYRDKFGEAPPVLWCDPPDQIQVNMDKMREAIDTGQPWSRPELENIPENILI